MGVHAPTFPWRQLKPSLLCGIHRVWHTALRAAGSFLFLLALGWFLQGEAQDDLLLGKSLPRTHERLVFEPRTVYHYLLISCIDTKLRCDLEPRSLLSKRRA